MSILIFHEDPEYRASLASILLEQAPMLADHPYQVTQCAEAGEMLQRLRGEAFDLLILDLRPDCSERSASLLAEVRRARAAQPVLVVTENACLETAWTRCTTRSRTTWRNRPRTKFCLGASTRSSTNCRLRPAAR